MKIAVLAPSNAGKTAYLSGLYGVLTDVLNDSSYDIRFQVTDVIGKRALSDRYDRLVDSGDFGKGDTDLRVYPLTLSTSRPDNSVAQLRIELVDFPGSDLLGSTEERAARVEEITQRLADCDGFIVLVDGDVFIHDAPQNATKLRKDLKASDVREVLYRALERRRNNTSRPETDPNSYAFDKGRTPVIFAMTKGDLVEEGFTPHQDKIVESVRQLFSGSAGDGYRDDEGPIANLIRSQFGKIISAPDVFSAITAITVYDTKRGTFAPRDLDTLLQLVLFQGLLNANLEYARRSDEWRNVVTRRKQDLANATDKLRKAENELQSDFDLPLWVKLVSFPAWVGIGLIDELAVDKARASKNAATARHNHGEGVCDLATANQSDAALFLRHVLPARLVYRLCQNANKSGLYQHGLPIDALSHENWWREKYSAGEGEVAS